LPHKEKVWVLSAYYLVEALSDCDQEFWTAHHV